MCRGVASVNMTSSPPSTATPPSPSSPISEQGPEPSRRPLQIAILLNSYHSRFLAAIKNSYVKTLGAVSPSAQLRFFAPADHAGELPDPALYDLIVVGGANVDARKSYPFILEIHEFLRHLVREWPEKKVVGICWGHQTIARVFGGRIEDCDVPEMGVTSIPLSTVGRSFFPFAQKTGTLHIQQHHRREVVGPPPPGFIQLSQDSNQILLNEQNTILTFQAHPEKDAATAMLRMHDCVRWFGMDVLDEKAWAALDEQFRREHEGEAVWRRILEWVEEPERGGGAVAGRL